MSEDIQRRVDFAQGYIDLNGLVSGMEDANAFMAQMLAYLVDQTKAAAAINADNLDTTPDMFPFTKEAIDSILNHIANDIDKALPSTIISWMGNGAIEAWRRREKSSIHQLVTAEIIEETIFPEG